VKEFQSITQEIATGLAPDIGSAAVPLWEDGENVIFQEGAVQPAPGQYLILPKPQSSIVRGITDARFSDGTRNLFLGTLTNLFRWIEDAASPVDVTRIVGDGGDYACLEDATITAQASHWSMVPWGDVIFATNYVDKLQVWELSSPANFQNFEDYSDQGADFRGAILGKIGPFLLIFRTKDTGVINDFTIIWCDNDDPTVFTPAVANAAGALEARDLGSPIIAAIPFANGYAAYGIDECRYVSFVGAPDYIGIRPLLEGVGALSKASVVAVGRVQYGMGARGIWMHDGSQHDYIDGPVHDYVFDNINQDQASKSIAIYDGIENLVIFSYPTAESLYNNRSVAFNRNNGTWTKLAYARTAYCPGKVWEACITGDRSGDVWLHSGIGFAPTGSGTPLSLVAGATISPPGYGGMGYGQGYYGSIGTIAPA
jgi:hypothetical protein